jgi:hypothetical protein
VWEFGAVSLLAFGDRVKFGSCAFASSIMAIRRSARLRRAQDTPEVSNIATTPVVVSLLAFGDRVKFGSCDWLRGHFFNLKKAIEVSLNYSLSYCNILIFVDSLHSRLQSWRSAVPRASVVSEVWEL